MSISTNAILFYGFCWDEEGLPWQLGSDEDYPDDADEEEAEESDEDWEVRYVARKGLAPFTEVLPELRDRRTGVDRKPTPEEAAAIARFSEYLDAKERLVAAGGVEVGSHCSDSTTMPYVAIKASIVEAWRGEPRRIDQTDTMRSPPDWDAQLRAFCKVMEIDVSGKEIGWWLVSYWG